MSKLVGVGSNRNAQLGIPYPRSHPSFIPSVALGFGPGSEVEECVEDVQCGSTFTLLLEKGGSVKICGTLHNTVFNVPTMLVFKLKCNKIACGNK